jgi:hypothetical protein
MSVLKMRRAREFAELSAAGWMVQTYRPSAGVLRLRRPAGRWSR